jgi:transcriptional regulator with GAF, ATPase, and Fis domain
VEETSRSIQTKANTGASLEELARKHIAHVLAQTDWRIEGPGGAAVILGLKPSTLRSRMLKLGIRKASAANQGPSIRKESFAS